MRARAALDDLFVPAFLVTTAVSLFRAPDLPHVTVDLGSTSLSVTLADLALGLLGVAAIVRIVRRRSLPRRTWPLLGAAAALSVLAHVLHQRAGLAQHRMVHIRGAAVIGAVVEESAHRHEQVRVPVDHAGELQADVIGADHDHRAHLAAFAEDA